MPVIHVVAAAIIGDDNKILLAQRPDHVHQGGLWEFPGGKVECGEVAREALTRELYEELAISVLTATPLIQIEHCYPKIESSFSKINNSYPEKKILLDVWLVTKYAGIPLGNEGQPIVWAKLNELDNYDFPEANQLIIAELSQRLEP